MRDHSPPPPYHGTLPDCFDQALLVGLLDGLPRPAPGAARLLGRQMLARALETVRLYRPRDALEAQLVQQIVIVTNRVAQLEAEARRQAGVEEMLRLDRHAARLRRSVDELERRLRRHRRECRMEGWEDAPAGEWEYELDALERHWREEAPLLVDRVPLWVMAGKRFMDELTNEEYEELVFAEMRGELLPLPPARPATEDGDPPREDPRAA
jgi:branched-subunit amino acid aminotransferase/4-amino-4-deoxychorismate lyase